MEAWLTFWEFAGSVAKFLAKSGLLYCQQKLASDLLVISGVVGDFLAVLGTDVEARIVRPSGAIEQRALLWADPGYEALRGGQDLPQQPQM